ncbi:MAG: hypothetical protein MUF61_01595 [archaeon]|jgi:hypothetical protein|nr:hypothetical protein [archaeon]
MEKRILTPDEVLCPGEYNQFYSEGVRRYFHMDKKGHAADWPGIIVAKSDPPAEMVAWFETKIREFLERYEITGEYRTEFLRKEYIKFIKAAEKSPYFLLDGNHRAIAATLAHSPLHVLELSRNEDLGEIEKMVESGDLFDWPHDERTINELRESFMGNCMDMSEMEGSGGKRYLFHQNSKLSYVKNFSDRVADLVADAQFPNSMADMVEFYKGGLK